MNKRLLAPQLLCVLFTLPIRSAKAQATPDSTASSTSQSTPVSNAVVLGSRSVVTLALEQSATLEQAQLGSERANWLVHAEENRYQFILGADATYAQATNPRLQANNQLVSNTARSFNFGVGLSRTFSTGTFGEFRLEGERFANEFSGGFVNPILNQASGFGSRLRFTLRQPFLRGSGTQLGEVELHAAEANQKQMASTRDRTRSALVRDVLGAYYELWYADQALRIEFDARELAQFQESEALDNVRRGALAPADALTLSSRVAELDESVLSAEATRSTRLLELGRIVGGNLPDIHETAPLALDEPEARPLPTKAELKAALAQDSLELAELSAQVAAAKVRAEVAGDALRPRLDAEGSLSSYGLGDNVGSAIERTGQFGWVTGQIGVTLELPLGDSRREATRAQALLDVRVAEANLRAAELELRARIETAELNARVAERRLTLAQKSREIAGDSRSAAEARFRLGAAIALQVREAEDTFRRAQLREARAKVDYVLKQLELEHVTGKLNTRYGPKQAQH